MIKNTVVAMSFVAMILAVMSQAQGALTWYEDFDYPASASIDGVGGWSNSNNTVGISATGLSYPGLGSRGGSAKYSATGNSAAGNYATKNPAGVAALFNSTSNVIYASLLVGDTVGGNSAHSNLWIFQDNGSGGWTDDGVTIDTTGGATPRVGLHKFGGGEAGVGSYSATAGTKLFAVRFTMKSGPDDVVFLLNPDLATLSDSDFDAGPTNSGELTGNLDHIIMYLAPEGTNTLMDEFRIGTTLADVFPGQFVPEPASLTLLGLGGLMLLRRRHA